MTRRGWLGRRVPLNEREVERLTSFIKGRNPTDAANALQRRVRDNSIPSPFTASSRSPDLDVSECDSAAEALAELVRVPGLTLLTGLMGSGKSHVIGELVVGLVAAEEPFVLLDAQDLDPGERSMVTIAGLAVSKVYGGTDPDVATEVVASGRVVVIVDGIEEVRDAQKLARAIAATRGDGRLRVLVAVRSSSTEVLTALGDVDAVVELEALEVAHVERQLVGAIEEVPSLAEALRGQVELRTPLAVALVQELEREPGRLNAVARSGSLDELWRQFIDLRLGTNDAQRQQLADHLGWVAYVMRCVERRPVLREERVVPEWLEGRRARAARVALAVSATPVLVVALIAYSKWRGLPWLLLVAWLVATSGVALVYWWKPLTAIDPNKNRTPPAVFQERAPSWAAFRRRASLEEYEARIGADVLRAMPAGVVVIGLGGPLIHRDFGGPVVNGLVFLAVLGVAAVLLFLVGKQSGPTWGTLGVAAVIGLGPSNEDLLWPAVAQGLAIGLISGFASGLVFGFFDLGDRRVHPTVGAPAPRRMVWNSWRVVASYETLRWMSFGLTFALLAVLARPVISIDRNWLWWGVGGGVAGSLIFGLSAGSYPFFNREISSWFLRRYRFGGLSLDKALGGLAGAGLLVKVGEGSAYRMHHVSMQDAAFELWREPASAR